MNAASSVIDLDDTDGLIGADRNGLLRAASMAGAQVRATAAAVDEGALESVTGGQRPRTVIWVAGRQTAATAGAMLAALLGETAGEPIVMASGAPPWIGPLDVLVVAGDDPGDPALAAAAATAVRRGARVIVVAPYEGPLRDATASRAAVLDPRLPVDDAFGLCRYLAAGLAGVAAVDDGLSFDIAALADELDAEALRSSAGRELFTNPAKALAERMTSHRVVLAGDSPPTLALAHHGSAVMLRVACESVAAAGLADVFVALRERASGAGFEASIFHDEQLDGPLPERLRVLALTLHDERAVVAARVAGLDDVDLVSSEDVPDADAAPVAVGGAELQLAVLAVRLEMAAVYLRLVRG
ncbi:MAG: TobH protein [Mycobacteriaceae bacterium]|nr:TobH protein [Mycobacteriaceae bacterium]